MQLEPAQHILAINKHVRAFAHRTGFNYLEQKSDRNGRVLSAWLSRASARRTHKKNAHKRFTGKTVRPAAMSSVMMLRKTNSISSTSCSRTASYHQHHHQFTGGTLDGRVCVCVYICTVLIGYSAPQHYYQIQIYTYRLHIGSNIFLLIVVFVIALH